jgi:nitrate/TMAO reductase-like tetraheme cytochrome c subunit
LQRFDLELAMQRSSAVIIVVVLLGVMIGLGICTFFYAKRYSYLTNNPAACANCHIMQSRRQRTTSVSLEAGWQCGHEIHSR